jgi:quercetin dioxygenase-like cupin family protein
MSFAVFDYRSDLINLLVTPHIRARFLRIEPGEVHGMHSHDLGHEVFFILEGHLTFYIDGQEQTLGPGQLCVALADQIHQVRNSGQEPVYMYLSVTPHIQPTHTGRDIDGTRHPTRFIASSQYDVETDTHTPIEELVDDVAARAEALAESARAFADAQRILAADLKKALQSGHIDAATRLRESLWEALRQTHKDLYAVSDRWNDLAPRAGQID